MSSHAAAGAAEKRTDAVLLHGAREDRRDG
jgi:hypothetical protein